MNRKQLLQLHEDMSNRSRTTMEAKNSDYADEAEDMVFGNLDLIEALFPSFTLSRLTTEVGIVIRMGDKLKRLATGVQRAYKVNDESFEDTCLDLINYSILLLAKHKSRQPDGGATQDLQREMGKQIPYEELKSLQERMSPRSSKGYQAYPRGDTIESISESHK